MCLSWDQNLIDPTKFQLMVSKPPTRTAHVPSRRCHRTLSMLLTNRYPGAWARCNYPGSRSQKINHLETMKSYFQILPDPMMKSLHMKQSIILKPFESCGVNDCPLHISRFVTGFAGTASFFEPLPKAPKVIDFPGQRPSCCDGVSGERIISKCLFRLPTDFGNQSPFYDVGQ